MVGSGCRTSEWCGCCFFFFNDTATTEIYTLSLHDALLIFQLDCNLVLRNSAQKIEQILRVETDLEDRKSTRLNSSHLVISYAVFCLKKKKKMKSRHLSLVLTSDV